MNDDAKRIYENYLLKGIAAGKTIEDVAKKHNVDLNDLKKEFLKGTKVEYEHTKHEKVAKLIALDHLFEDPKYYSKLAQVEKN